MGVEIARTARDCRLPGTGGATERPWVICDSVPAETRHCAYDRSSHQSSQQPDRRMTQRRPDSVVTVLQISDTHLHAAADSRMRGVTTYATLLSVLEHVRRDRRWTPDVILATGDIVQDESRAGYERFRTTMEPLGVPVLSIPGNHDDPKLMGEILNSGSFQFGGELRHGPWSIVLLSTFLAGEDAGGLGPARLQGLRKALAVHANQHVLVAMHHHPLPMGSTWLDGVALRDAKDFWQIIDANPNVR